MISSNLILIESTFYQYSTPQVNILFLFAMLLIYGASSNFILSNSTWISWAKVICPSVVISTVIYKFAFNMNLLLPTEVHNVMSDLLMLRLLACFAVLILSLLVTVLLQFFGFAKYINKSRYYKFCTILFLNFFGIPYLELSLVCSTFFANLSTHNYLKFLKACSIICKNLQNRFVLFASIGAIITIYTLSEEAFAASRTNQTGASLATRVGPMLRKCLEGNDPEDVKEFQRGLFRYTMQKLGLVEDTNVVDRRPKLKKYDPTEFTCKNERNVLPAHIIQELVVEKPLNMKSCHARLLNRINNGELKGTYQPVYYKGANFWNNRIPTRESFFKTETKVSYQNTEISANGIHNKLLTKQLNDVFSRETKENYARKTILFDQICSGLTADQVNKVFLNHKK